MPRVLYTAFDIVPSPKGASTHILHNIRGLVNSQFDVHLLTPNDGVHYRNIWDGLAVARNKKRFGYKTLFEVNGLPSIELKYHYPGIDLNLLAKIKEQE